MSGSLTSIAPPSTITIASREQAITRSMSLSSRCLAVGLATHSPFTRPTRIPAIGPLNGMSEQNNAAEAPVMPWIALSFEVAPRDSPGGIKPLLVLHRERQEVDLALLPRRHRSDQ